MGGVVGQVERDQDARDAEQEGGEQEGQPGEPVAEDQGVEADGDGDQQDSLEEDPPVAVPSDALGLEVRPTRAGRPNGSPCPDRCETSSAWTTLSYPEGMNRAAIPRRIIPEAAEHDGRERFKGPDKSSMADYHADALAAHRGVQTLR